MTSGLALWVLATSLLTLGDAAPPETRLRWDRQALDEITVTGTPAARSKEAHRVVTAVAARLDALRTVRRHVLWRSIRWEEGRLEVEARAEDAVHGNVAVLAVRALFGKDVSTAGSGVQVLPRAQGPYGWHIKILAVPALIDAKPAR